MLGTRSIGNSTYTNRFGEFITVFEKIVKTEESNNKQRNVDG